MGGGQSDAESAGTMREEEEEGEAGAIYRALRINLFPVGKRKMKNKTRITHRQTNAAFTSERMFPAVLFQEARRSAECRLHRRAAITRLFGGGVGA